VAAPARTAERDAAPAVRENGRPLAIERTNLEAGGGGVMDRERKRAAAGAFLTATCAVLLARAAAAGTPIAGYTDTAYVTGLSQPTAIAFLPDGRLLITQKGGAVRLFDAGTTTDVGTIGVCTGSEMGLLGIALDPAFAANGVVYLYRTENDGGCGSATGRSNQVVRAVLSGTTLGAPEPILDGIRTDNGNHDGGGLRLGPDDKLWVAVGDTGAGDFGDPGDSTNPYAQDLNSLNGKILRIELNGSPAAGNPFIGQAGRRGEIYAYGFRNPFRIGFDPVGGFLWAGDVGQNTIEEIDRVVAGGNYSWPYCEGSLPDGCEQAGDVLPAYEYPRSAGGSVTGGAFAVGGSRYGEYFFGDYVSSRVWQATLDPARTAFAGTPTEIITNAGGPVDFVFGPDGALYYVAINVGQVRRVGNAGFGPPATTTTTTTPATSTTTTTVGGCAQAPATFPCARAAVESLLATILALGDLDGFEKLLSRPLVRARSALDQAERKLADGRLRAARGALKRAGRQVQLVARRLTNRRAERVLAENRPALQSETADVLQTVRAI
jgi:glucose/arabinose dehydrogenase